MPNLMSDVLSQKTGPERITYFKTLMNEATKDLDTTNMDANALLTALIEYLKTKYDLKNLSFNDAQKIKEYLSTWNYEPADQQQSRFGPEAMNFTSIHTAFTTLIAEEVNALQLAGAPENRGIQEKFLMGNLEPKTELISRDIQRFFTYEGINGYIPEAFLSTEDSTPIVVYQRLHNIHTSHTNNPIDNLDDFIKYLYQIQLEHIDFSKVPENLRIPQLSAQFNEEWIKPEAIEKLMGSEDFKQPTAVPEHSLITQTIAELSLYESQLEFPLITPKEPPLNSADYEQFLILSHAKLQTPEASKLLENLVIKCENNDALWGLSSYCGTYHQLPFERLTLDFYPYTQTNDIDNFTASIKQLLVRLSESDTQTIQLMANFSPEQLDALITLIQENDKIAIDIELPDLLSPQQQQIDEILSDRIRDKNIQKSTQTLRREKLAAPKRPVQMRGTGNVSPQIDFELEEEEEQEEEQEQEVEVQDEEPPEAAQLSGDTKHSDAPGSGDYSMGLFYGDEYQGKFPPIPGKKEASDDVSVELEATFSIWRNWVGALSDNDADHNAPLLSFNACEALINHYEAFQYGLDLNHLPAGFEAVKSGPRIKIEYNDNLQKLSASDPLQVQLRPPPVRAALTHNQMKKLGIPIPEHEFGYDRDKDKADRQSCVPENTANKTEKIAFLNKLTSNARQIKTLQEKIPNLNLDALIQLYLTHGTAGFDKLIRLQEANPDNFNLIHDTVFSNAITYATCLDTPFDEALKNIDNFLGNERVWFFKLLEEHCKAQSQVNLVDLVNAFAAFKTELNKISLPPGAHFNFYDNPQFHDTKSLPVTLSRMLYILEHVDEANREAQWQDISTLDLSSTGAVKAFSATGEKEWAFITPEMQITQTHEVSNPTQNKVTNYEATNEWSVSSIKKNFFRDIAFQPKGEQLPLAFYQDFQRKINGLDEAIQIELYQLIFKATTGLKKDSEKLSAAEATTYLDDLLTSIQGITLPLIGRSKILELKVTLLNELNQLEPVPKFPILNRLTSLIASCCTITAKATGVVEKLKEANTNLRNYVALYGDNVYEGMTHYTEDQYKNPELFFEHLKTIKKIDLLSFTHLRKIEANLFISLDNLETQVEKVNKKIQRSKDALETNPENEEQLKNLTTLQSDKKRFEDEYNSKKIKAERYTNQLLSLISTFNLKPDTIEKLINALPASPQKEKVEACCDLLQHLTFKGLASPLRHQHLLDLIEAIKSDEGQNVIEIIANNQTITPYFPEGFLERYNNPSVPDELKESIKEQFKEQSDAVLKLLNRAGSAVHYEEITENIIAVCHGIKDDTERKVFLKKLTESRNICPLIPPGTNQEPPLITLLSLIKTKKAHHDFIGLMNIERKKNNVINRLPERTTAYIQDILPGVRATRPRIISDSLLKPLIQNILLGTDINDDASMDAYTQQFKALLEQINGIGEENPIIKKPLITLLNKALEETNDLNSLKTLTDTLQAEFEKVADKNIVLSLCLHFSEAPHKPSELQALLETIKDNPFLLTAAVAVLNTDKGYSLEDLIALKAACNASNELQALVEKAYERAPYPSIKQVLKWHTEEGKLDAKYEYFDKSPAHRETESGFDEEHAHKQLTIMANNPNNVGFDSEILSVNAFKTLTLKMRDKTSEELIALFKTSGDPVNYEQLVAVAAELLYRSKGRDNPAYIEGQYELGSSMELNTTQYLAILTSLKTGTHVTSQMGTGEGKSRTMMVSALCQQAMGNTVDFVTSDIELAYRDFVEYKPLFDMVGVNSTMITASSSSASYQMGGINFSDTANFNLFRNKAATKGQQKLVLAEDPKKRALLLDEADKTYFDMVNTRFNFSQKGSEIIINMPWVYDLLMAYMADDSAQRLYQSGDVHAIRDAFLNYVNSTESSPKEKARIHAVSDKKLDEWIDSAKAAQKLQFNKDFSIIPDLEAGGRVSSEAKLKALRTSSDAKFSRGVQQCLHARLNRAKKNPIRENDEELKQALTQCETDFFVSNEKQIIYSTSSKNFLDDYREGRVQAVTGTAGSIAEREEARVLNGHKDGNMHILELPRHQGLKRFDSPIRLARDDTQQIHYLIKAIIKAQADNQPILIFCENDIESAELMEKLQAHSHFLNQKINRIHGDMSKEEERAGVNKAGVAGEITISTGMIGRGTDISLQDKAKENGLNVMVTYLPEERDLEQMIGRSGRFGKKGDTRLFLNKEKLKQQLGKKSLGSEGYYYNPEAFIRREQAIMTRKKQCERLIKNRFSDFKKELQDNFFNTYLPNVVENDREQMQAHWVKFIDNMDKVWNEKWSHIQGKLYDNPINIPEIESLLDEFQTETQKLWVIVRDNTTDEKEDLLDVVPELNLNETVTKLLTSINTVKNPEHKVYDRYDPAHDGRHVEYSSWRIPMIASLKGLWNSIPFTSKYDVSEARAPFANIRAWWRGEGQIFPNLSYQISKFRDFLASDNKLKTTSETPVPPIPDPQAEQEVPAESTYDKFKNAGLVRQEKVVDAQNDLEQEFDEDDEDQYKDTIEGPLDAPEILLNDLLKAQEKYAPNKKIPVPPEVQEALDKKKTLTQDRAEDEDHPKKNRDDSISGGP